MGKIIRKNDYKLCFSFTGKTLKHYTTKAVDSPNIKQLEEEEDVSIFYQATLWVSLFLTQSQPCQLMRTATARVSNNSIVAIGMITSQLHDLYYASPNATLTFISYIKCLLQWTHQQPFQSQVSHFSSNLHEERKY